MKQVHPNYTFVASTKTITLTGLNIPQDQLLLITNATRGVIYYNFVSSSHKATVTAGANTTVVLTDASTTGHADSDQLIIHYDDHTSTQTIAGTVTANVIGRNANYAGGVTALQLPIIAYDETIETANAQVVVPVQITNTLGVVGGSNALPISGTVTVGNSITISNFPATQVVRGSSSDGGGNIALRVNFPGGSNNTRIQNYSSGDLLFITPQNAAKVDGSAVTQPITGTITVGNSVTIGSLPAIAGTVTVGGFSSVSVGSGALLIGGLRGGSVVGLPLDSASGNVSVQLRQTATTTNEPISQSNPLWVTQQGSVTIGSLPAISGTVTANVGDASNLVGGGYANLVDLFANESLQVSQTGTVVVDSINNPISGTVTVSNAVELANALIDQTAVYGSLDVNIGGSSITQSVSGTVTIGALPSGSLTTRFGSVATANLAFITSAVTNASRKYLLAQNISAGTVTIGIGFSPTTTQGIQLTAGGGLTFDAFCPTGAVYWLGAVTGAAFTILEG